MHLLLAALLTFSSFVNFCTFANASNHFSSRSPSYYGRTPQILNRNHLELGHSLTTRSPPNHLSTQNPSRANALSPRNAMNKFNLGDLFHEASHGSPRREAFDLEHVAKDVSSSPVAEFMDHEINKGSLNKENVKERWDGVVGSAKMLQAQRIKHFMAQKVPAKSLKRYKKAAKAHEAAFAKYYDTVVGKIEEKNSRKDAGAESSKTPADYEMWVKGKTGKKGRKGKGGGFSTGLAKGFLN